MNGMIDERAYRIVNVVRFGGKYYWHYYSSWFSSRYKGICNIQSGPEKKLHKV